MGSLIGLNTVNLIRDDCRFSISTERNITITEAQREMIAKAIYLGWHYTISNVGAEFDIHVVNNILSDDLYLGSYKNGQITLPKNSLIKAYDNLYKRYPQFIFNRLAAHEVHHQVQEHLGWDLDEIPDPKTNYKDYWNHAFEIQSREVGFQVHRFLYAQAIMGSYPENNPLFPFAERYDEHLLINQPNRVSVPTLIRNAA
jgi:hypothetical protein